MDFQIKSSDDNLFDVGWNLKKFKDKFNYNLYKNITIETYFCSN